MVDYNGLENRRAERHRGFESLSLRIKPDYQAFVVLAPNFTPSFGREIGCFVWGLKGRKEGELIRPRYGI